MATTMEPRVRVPVQIAQRGSSLIVALIAIGVLMVLVVAAIQFTGINREGAVAKLRSDELAACAESAKRMLISQLQDPTASLTGQAYEFELPDRPTNTERTKAYTGHYGEEDGGFGSITAMSGSSIAASSRLARDLSNAAPTQTSFGGIPYRVVMKCKDARGRESEIEFVFRYGI